MATHRRVVYDANTWRQGTRGRLDRWVTELPRIVNLQVYKSGLLGPRPFWKQQTSYAHGYGQIEKAGRKATDFLWIDDIYAGDSWLGMTLERSNDGGGGYHPVSMVIHNPQAGGTWDNSVYAGSHTAYPSYKPMGIVDCPPHSVPFFAETTLSPLARKVTAMRYSQRWDLRPSTPAATVSIPIAPMPNSSVRTEHAIIHQSRMFYWGNPEYPKRVAYSDPYNFLTFTSTAQYFDVDQEVEGLITVGSSLYIFCRTFDWYVLQGRGNPADGTLSYLGKGPIPRGPGFYALDQNVCYFLDPTKGTMVAVTPEGIDFDAAGHLGFADTTPNDYPLRAWSAHRHDAHGLLWRYNGEVDDGRYLHYRTDVDKSVVGLERINGVWVEVDYGPGIIDSDLSTRAHHLDRGGYYDVAVDEKRGVLWMVQGWHTGNTPASDYSAREDRYLIFTRHISQDEPVRLGDSYSNPAGDVYSSADTPSYTYSNHYCELPVIRPETPDERVRIRSVSVELATWRTDEPNQYPDVSLSLWVVPQGDVVGTPALYQLTSDLEQSKVPLGTPGAMRVMFRPDQDIPWAPGYYIIVWGPRSCALRTIIVDVEEGRGFE